MPRGIYNKTEEHKSRIGLANKGKLVGIKRPKEVIDKIKKSLSARRKRLGYVNSPETRKKLSLALIGRPQLHNRGKKSHLWRGGITPQNLIIRTSIEYKNWRRSVFKRDGYRCVFCKRKRVVGDRVVLNADHIKPFSLYPELRFDINNGRTLCTECHKQTDTYGVNARYLKRGHE